MPSLDQIFLDNFHTDNMHWDKKRKLWYYIITASTMYYIETHLQKTIVEMESDGMYKVIFPYTNKMFLYDHPYYMRVR